MQPSTGSATAGYVSSTGASFMVDSIFRTLYRKF